jgi:hypothetical protein
MDTPIAGRRSLSLIAVPARYPDARAPELRERHASCSRDEIPVSVISIADDPLGPRIEMRVFAECSGMLARSQRLIFVNAKEAVSGDAPLRRHRPVECDAPSWRGNFYCPGVPVREDRRPTASPTEMRGTLFTYRSACHLPWAEAVARS